MPDWRLRRPPCSSGGLYLNMTSGQLEDVCVARPVAQYKALPMEASSSNIGSEERDEAKGAERVEEPSTVHLIRGDSRLPAMTAPPDQVRRRGRRPPALIRMGRSDPHFSESWMAALLLRPKPLNAWV